MSFITSIWTDLRERRLWPVALVLLVCVVAVPTLLAKPAPPVSSVAAAPAPPSGTAPAGTALPAVSVVAVHERHLRGQQRNPFAQQRLHLPGAGKSSGSGGKGPATSSSGKGTQPSTASGGGTSTTPAGGGSTTTPTPTPTPTPEPALLSDTEAYHVAVSVANSSGGVNAVDPFQRLSALPDNDHPLLVELGVLRGGTRVLFALAPDTGVRSAGTCTPGPLNCEILSLPANKTATVWGKSSDGSQVTVQFAVTAIRVAHYGSAAAAAKARGQVSSAGRRALRQLSLPALSLFQYRPSLGAVVDLRNLTVGGS